jgi:hypothetical protein
MKAGIKLKELRVNHPPIKNIENCTEEIIRCKYSHKNISKSIGPLYSVEYPATTSDSVSAWSKGARLDSKNKTTTKLDAAGAYNTKFQ